jgi:hypothetical protein
MHSHTLVPTHSPAWQVSPWVQALPSSQESVLLLYKQPYSASQVSVVQGLLSLQEMAAPAQTPSAQVSPRVQALWSSQKRALWV